MQAVHPSSDAIERANRLVDLVRTELERVSGDERQVLRDRLLAIVVASAEEEHHVGHVQPGRSRRLSVGALIFLCAICGIVLAPLVPPVGVVVLLLTLALAVGAAIAAGGRTIGHALLRRSRL